VAGGHRGHASPVILDRDRRTHLDPSCSHAGLPMPPLVPRTAPVNRCEPSSASRAKSRPLRERISPKLRRISLGEGSRLREAFVRAMTDGFHEREDRLDPADLQGLFGRAAGRPLESKQRLLDVRDSPSGQSTVNDCTSDSQAHAPRSRHEGREGTGTICGSRDRRDRADGD
jgi:hypothetical protein